MKRRSESTPRASAARNQAELEAALRDLETGGQGLFGKFPVPILVYDLEDLSILSANPAALERYGYSLEEFRGMNLRDIRPSEDIPKFEARMAAFPDGLTRSSGVWRHQTRDGRILHVEIVTFPLELRDRRINASIVVDITDRVQAEDARRRSEARWRVLFEAAPVGIYQSARDGTILTANAELARILGYASPEELLPLNMRDFYSDPAQREEAIRAFEAIGLVADQFEWRRKDGTLITIQINAQAVRSAEGGTEYFEGFVRDITQRVRLEAQLRQSQKMEAVGRLAGGVAHDFNNLLTAILGYGDLLLVEMSTEDPRRERVEEIRRAGHRAASLTQQLLAFSRRQVLQPRVVDLNQVVAELIQMLNRLIGEDIRIVTVLDSMLPPVRVDPPQIQQVVINLAVNARDAMPQGGQLRIETHSVVLDQEYVRTHSNARPGPHVLLSVKDTGIGMDAETLSHIFEPFYTTKELGKGTGLGLSTVYGIVDQSGGHVTASSQPGRGTVIDVYLPCASEAPAESEAPSDPIAQACASDTVLVASPISTR